MSADETPPEPKTVMLLYDFEDEHLLRRLGGAVIKEWPYLPSHTRQRILRQACLMFDRDHPNDLAARLQRFVARFNPRMETPPDLPS